MIDLFGYYCLYLCVLSLNRKQQSFQMDKGDEEHSVFIWVSLALCTGMYRAKLLAHSYHCMHDTHGFIQICTV